MGKEELRYRVHSKEKENCNKGQEILFTCIKLIPCSFKSLYLFKYSLCLKCLFSHSPVAVGIRPGSNAFALKDEGEGFSPYTLTLTPYILWCGTVRNHAFVSPKHTHTHTHTHIYIKLSNKLFWVWSLSSMMADFYWILTVVRKCLKYFQFINSCRSLIAYLWSQTQPPIW